MHACINNLVGPSFAFNAIVSVYLYIICRGLYDGMCIVSQRGRMDQTRVVLVSGSSRVIGEEDPLVSDGERNPKTSKWTRRISTMLFFASLQIFIFVICPQVAAGQKPSTVLCIVTSRRLKLGVSTAIALTTQRWLDGQRPRGMPVSISFFYFYEAGSVYGINLSTLISTRLSSSPFPSRQLPSPPSSSSSLHSPDFDNGRYPTIRNLASTEHAHRGQEASTRSDSSGTATGSQQEHRKFGQGIQVE